MIAAIYARKSTEQNGVADEQKVARQVEHTRGAPAGRSYAVPRFNGLRVRGWRL